MEDNQGTTLRDIILSCLTREITFLQIDKHKIFPYDDQEIILDHEISTGYFAIKSNDTVVVILSIKKNDHFIGDFIVYYKDGLIKRIEFDKIKISFQDDK